jgi:hypothetical protein
MDNKIIKLEQFFGKTDNKLGKFGTDDSGVIGNMDSVFSEAKSIETRSKDIVIAKRSIAIETTPFNIHLGALTDPYPFTNWSLGQICSHLGVPAQYVRKCMEENELEFAAENLNKWLDKGDQEKKFLLRTTDERLQGFLSSGYGIMDDVNVLEVLKDIVPGQGDFTVQNSLVTPGLLNIRLVDRHKIKIDGEDLSVALNIKNSRVGQSSLEVRLMIFKWICTNGIIFGGGKGSLYTKVHRGSLEQDFRLELSKNLSYLPQIIEDIKYWVERSKDNILNDSAIQSAIDKMKAESYSSITINAKIIELIPKYSKTTWGLSQAITEVSQDYSLDVRESMERFAGYLITAS